MHEIALEDNVSRLQHGGADFALSISQVAGQLLAHHILGVMVSQQAHIKLVKRSAAQFAGYHPLQADLDAENQCSIVAVERAGEVVMDFPREFRLEQGDEIYVCGTIEALNRFYDNNQQGEQPMVTAPV